ncbi:hypothetical protein [Rhizobium tumorigenes]|uniref:hypothetical protein n=1 Tax=Rhizobium tumorigenes TaxID=2041385 RepID=UPI00241ED957|nr:hypothetical protein [Rhizobium tumorigenes]WFS02372.1 hypothetical protein PR016_07100 [Rhizobium tumorigenes]
MKHRIESLRQPRLLDAGELVSFGIGPELLERFATIPQSALVPVPVIDFTEISVGCFHLVSVIKE